MTVSSRPARSPRLTMPQSLPFSTMGSRRTCSRPMRWEARLTSISGLAVTTRAVMTWLTWVFAGSRPAARQRVTMSRSVTRPFRLPS